MGRVRAGLPLGAGLVLTALAGCAERAVSPVEADAHAPTRTREGRYFVAWEAVPEPVPLNELFELRVTVTEAKTGARLEEGALHVDARMPQHGHGMMTKPEVEPGSCAGGTCRHVGGVYVVRGMKFHMPGTWTLSFEVDGPAGADRLDVLEPL